MEIHSISNTIICSVIQHDMSAIFNQRGLNETIIANFLKKIIIPE